MNYINMFQVLPQTSRCSCGKTEVSVDKRRCRTVMGLWCGTRTSRRASAWTPGRGMWDTSVSSTAISPCTETQLKEITVCLFSTRTECLWLLQILIVLAHVQHADLQWDTELWGHCCHVFYCISLHNRPSYKQVQAKKYIEFKLPVLLSCLSQHKIQALR